MGGEGSEMLILKLAYRNLTGARLRTWLNVGILSLAYVLIIGYQGMFIGMFKQGAQGMISDEIAGGHYRAAPAARQGKV